MAKVPNILYKYRHVNANTLSMLMNGQVFFADFDDLNDPSECRPKVVFDCSLNELEDIRDLLIQRRREKIAERLTEEANLHGYYLKEVRENANPCQRVGLKELYYFDKLTNEGVANELLSSTVDQVLAKIEFELRGIYKEGVFCASETECEALLWSHYGDEHRGICIGYRVIEPESKTFRRVRYGGTREILATDILKALHGDKSAIRRVETATLYRKANWWKYEREWRSVDVAGKRGVFLAPSEIVFGLRCEDAVRCAVVKAMENKRPIRYSQIVMEGAGYDLTKADLDVGELKKKYLSMGFTFSETVAEVLKRMDAKENQLPPSS